MIARTVALRPSIGADRTTWTEKVLVEAGGLACGGCDLLGASARSTR